MTITDKNTDKENIPFNNEWERAANLLKNGDYAGALYLFKKLEREGSLDAIIQIGKIYDVGGNGVDQNYEEAKRWYLKALNFAGDIRANVELGRMYYLGHGVKQDYTKAFNYLSKLKNEEDQFAIYMLGVLYQKGEGVDKDLKMAAYYFKKSYGLGFLPAQHALGLIKIKEGNILEGALLSITANIRAIKNKIRGQLNFK